MGVNRPAAISILRLSDLGRLSIGLKLEKRIDRSFN